MVLEIVSEGAWYEEVEEKRPDYTALYEVKCFEDKTGRIKGGCSANYSTRRYHELPKVHGH